MVNIHSLDLPVVALPKRFLALCPALEQGGVARVTLIGHSRIIDET